MRYNDYEHDPLCVGKRRSGSCAISARGDLTGPAGATNGFPSGGVDAKITAFSMSSRPAGVGDVGAVEVEAVCGPTHDQQPVFSWQCGKACNVSHVGLPEAFDFDYVRIPSQPPTPRQLTGGAEEDAGATMRPEDYGCVPDGETLCSPAIRKAVRNCAAAGGCTLEFAGPGTYLTQAFNLTSNIIVKIGPNATILGTSEDRFNLEKDGGDWPVLPWPEYPSLPTRSPSPAAQAVVRGYNLTNVSIVAEPGGMLDCGGTYWICQAWGGEATTACKRSLSLASYSDLINGALVIQTRPRPTVSAAASKAHDHCSIWVADIMSCDDLGNDLASRTPNGYCLHPPCNSSFDCSGPPPHRNCLERPRCLHLLGTDHIRITNLTMRNAPFWVSAAAPFASSVFCRSSKRGCTEPPLPVQQRHHRGRRGDLPVP